MASGKLRWRGDHRSAKANDRYPFIWTVNVDAVTTILIQQRGDALANGLSRLCFMIFILVFVMTFCMILVSMIGDNHTGSGGPAVGPG